MKDTSIFIADNLLCNLTIGVTRPDWPWQDIPDDNEMYLLPAHVQLFTAGALFARRHPEYLVALLKRLDEELIEYSEEETVGITKFLEFTDKFVEEFPIG